MLESVHCSPCPSSQPLDMIALFRRYVKEHKYERIGCDDKDTEYQSVVTLFQFSNSGELLSAHGDKITRWLFCTVKCSIWKQDNGFNWRLDRESSYPLIHRLMVNLQNQKKKFHEPINNTTYKSIKTAVQWNCRIKIRNRRVTPSEPLHTPYTTEITRTCVHNFLLPCLKKPIDRIYGVIMFLSLYPWTQPEITPVVEL